MKEKSKVQECTGQELVRAISYDPSWARTLKAPLKITTFVNLNHGKITHLSEHLVFCGKNQEGFSATFEGCKSLQVPLGKYHGGVIFKESGVTHIPNDKHLFDIVSPSRNGMAASFEGCLKLLEATGQYPGAIDFSGSGVEEIVDLIVNGAWEEYKGLHGFSAAFFGCHNLKEGAGIYAHAVDFSASAITCLNQKTLRIRMPNKNNVAMLLAACRNFKTLSGEFPGAICLDNSSVREITHLKIEIKTNTNKNKGAKVIPRYIAQTPLNPTTKLSIRNCTSLISLPIGFDKTNTICEPELMEKLLRKQKLVEEMKKQGEEENFAI